jgi:23S rRNA (adenine1618-N6)-methyltransferase
MKSKTVQTEKSNLHPRNPHRFRYDFEKLIKALPELASFVITNTHNEEQTIDFSNSDAVIALNKALLVSEYRIENWNIPSNYLCPPIPGRADYIHYLADLLAESNNGTIP